MDGLIDLLAGSFSRPHRTATLEPFLVPALKCWAIFRRPLSRTRKYFLVCKLEGGFTLLVFRQPNHGFDMMRLRKHVESLD